MTKAVCRLSFRPFSVQVTWLAKYGRDSKILNTFPVEQTWRRNLPVEVRVFKIWWLGTSHNNKSMGLFMFASSFLRSLLSSTTVGIVAWMLTSILTLGSVHLLGCKQYRFCHRCSPQNWISWRRWCFLQRILYRFFCASSSTKPKRRTFYIGLRATCLLSRYKNRHLYSIFCQLTQAHLEIKFKKRINVTFANKNKH